jgi:hypothetical protein
LKLKVDTVFAQLRWKRPAENLWAGVASSPGSAQDYPIWKT